MDCARNIITANFSGGGTSATTAPLWQWDYGQVLCITGIDLPAAFEVHFSTNRTGGVSTVAVGADGQVTIPNELLTIGKNINAWIYLSDSEGEGETEYSITIPVKARPMPETYDAEVSGEFDDVVRQVSEYAQTAQTAADNAGASASAAAASASEAAASASAAESAKTAAETAQGEAEDAQTAAETAAQTATEKAQQSAQDAAQTAQSKADAESAAGRAEAAQTGAESAKTGAETAAQDAADSASAASASATSAGQAATSAGQSATAAAGSATTAENAAQTATTKAGEASASATAANTAKTAAQTAQTGAEAAKDTAVANATTATEKATEAAQSASNAAASETAAEAAATRAEQAAETLTVDSALSDTSVNPVQNKVITESVTRLKTAIDDLNDLVQYHASPNLYDAANNHAGRSTETKGEYSDWTTWTTNLFENDASTLYFSQLPYLLRVWNGNTFVGSYSYNTFVSQPNGTYKVEITQIHDWVAFESAKSGTGYINFDNDFMVSESPITEYEPYGFGYPVIHDERIARYSDVPASHEDITSIVTKDIIIGKRISNIISVGDQYVESTVSYRAIAKAKIPDNAIGVYISCVDDNVYPKYAVIDSTGKVLKIASLDSAKQQYCYGCYVNLKGLTAPDKICFEVTATSTYSVLFADYSREKYVINSGNTIGCTANTGVKNGQTAHNGDVIVFDCTSDITLTFSDVEARSIGIWMKCPTFADSNKLSRIDITLYNGNSAVMTVEGLTRQALQMENWILVKEPTNGIAVNKIVLSPVLASGETSAAFMLSDSLLVNNFVRPVSVIDFDHTWQASEDCGAYDLLFNNDVPFTITGRIEHDVSKLKAYYRKGLFDAGTYANEDDVHTLPSGATDLATLISNAENRISEKYANGFVATSFGGGSHIITPLIYRALVITGYSAIKGGATNITGSVLCDEPDLIYLGMNLKTMMNLGGTALYFTHGVSINPSLETDPSLYVSYSDFSAYVNELLALDGVWMMNMKQYSDMRKKNGIT